MVCRGPAWHHGSPPVDGHGVAPDHDRLGSGAIHVARPRRSAALLVLSGAIWRVSDPSLQSLAVRFTTIGLSLLGIPNFADGIVIEIPEGTFLVHQACSGLRFLIASAAFSVFFSCLIYTSPLRRVLFIAAAFAVAVIANDFRVFGIILIAHFLGNTQAVETGHVLWGWLFYVIVGSVLVLMGLTFRQERRSPIHANPPVPGRFTGAAFAAVVFVVLLATMPRVAANYFDELGPDAAVAAEIAPPALAGCTIIPLSAAGSAAGSAANATSTSTSTVCERSRTAATIVFLSLRSTAFRRASAYGRCSRLCAMQNPEAEPTSFGKPKVSAEGPDRRRRCGALPKFKRAAVMLPLPRHYGSMVGRLGPGFAARLRPVLEHVAALGGFPGDGGRYLFRSGRSE